MLSYGSMLPYVSAAAAARSSRSAYVLHQRAAFRNPAGGLRMHTCLENKQTTAAKTAGATQNCELCVLEHAAYDNNTSLCCLRLKGRPCIHFVAVHLTPLSTGQPVCME
jgi:hypothetical protein